MTHTPGPWYLDNVLFVVRPGPLPDGSYPDKKVAAIYGWTPEDNTLAKSNGNLISAAPDLLEALEFLLKINLHGPGIAQAKSAVAKARGKSESSNG